MDLERAVRHCLLDVDDRVERLPVHLDQRERILGLLGRLGDDDGDPGTGERDAVDLEHARRVDEVLDPARLPGARQRRQLLEVLAGVDAHDARRGRGGRRVDGADAGVGVGRAENRRVHHASQRQVVEVRGRAGDHAGVLDALDGLADQAGRLLLDHLGHAGTSVPAAARTARTMFS